MVDEEFPGERVGVHLALVEAKVVTNSLSKPPSGKCKVTNFYVDPVTGKLVVEYDDTPTP